MASITKRGNGYRILVSNGYDVKGKKLQETTTFIPDPTMTAKQQKKALDDFAYEFEKRVKNGKYLSGEKTTFKEFTEKWLLEYASHNLELTTRNSYEYNLNNKIFPALGHLKLSKIQPLHLQSFYNNLQEPGVRMDGKKKGYSPATILKCHTILSSILRTAVEWQVIESNPCDRVSPPKQLKDISVKHFTLEQSQTFLRALDMEYTTTYQAHDRNGEKNKSYHVEEYTAKRGIPLHVKVMFYLALFAGLRKGELVALTWNDINFEKNIISINKSAANVKGQVFIKNPKNRTSIREVSIPGFVIELLKKYKTEQKELKIKLGDQWQGSEGKDWQRNNNVFIQWNGKQIGLSTPYHAFKDIIHKYNLTVSDESLKLPDIPFHGLRHTSATMLIAENVNIRTVSARLGHAQTSTTMNIYAHSLKESDKKASDKLDKLFNVQIQSL